MHRGRLLLDVRDYAPTLPFPSTGNYFILEQFYFYLPLVPYVLSFFPPFQLVSAGELDCSVPSTSMRARPHTLASSFLTHTC